MKISTRDYVRIGICFLAFSLPLCSFAQYGPNDYVLSTQAQVDAFDPVVLEGKNLVVSGNDITNIDQLANVIAVNGLIIENNPNLASLAPLNNLDSVTAELRIANNAALTNLDGFTSLRSVVNLLIDNNASLTSIDGFNALISTYEFSYSGGSIFIQNNPSLITIGGFNAIVRGQRIKIQNNDKVTGITGFQSLNRIIGSYLLSTGTLIISDNDALVGLDGFPSLMFIGYLYVTENDSLKNIRGFTNWTTTSNSGIRISDNASLEDLDGLVNLRIVEDNPTSFGIHLNNNPSLTRPCGIFPLVNTLVPSEIGVERLDITGSGFHLYEILSCGSTNLIVPPAPLIQLGLNQAQGVAPINSGTAAMPFVRSSGTPVSTTNVPADAGGTNSFDFGTTPGNYYVESTAPIDGLKNLNAFTLTGWVNCKSSVAGSGGNRIVSWINNGGEGVDLVYQSNGSLRLGVDGWPDFSPAFSNPNKVTTNASGANSNWVFFAVTYQSDGQVQFYFGNNETDAVLDVTRTYSGPGVTGSAIGKLAIGAFNDATRNSNTYNRMFRGMIDDIQVFGSVLMYEKILAVQHNVGTPKELIPPSAPGNVAITSFTNTSVTVSWTEATDNVGVVGYTVEDSDFRVTLGPEARSYTIPLVPEPDRLHRIRVSAFDEVGNDTYSDFILYTEPTSALVRLNFNEAGGNPANIGTANAIFVKSSGVPSPVANTPTFVGGANALDFGTTTGNYYVESSAPIDQLKNLNSFTISGWVNNKSSVTGSGGNRIVSWINNGGDGVDLVYQSDGSLRLGVDGWPDFSPAFSSASKIPTDPSAPNANWTFFAVTYSATDGQVNFYFGGNNVNATLDVTRTYTGPGTTGANIGKLAIGSFNDATRNSGTWDRMFKGLIDNIQIHGTVLSPSNIVALQFGTGLLVDRTPPDLLGGVLTVVDSTPQSVTLDWSAGTDNVGITKYLISANNLQYVVNAVANANIHTSYRYTATGLTPGTTYALSLRAQDEAGNISNPGPTVTLTTPGLSNPLIHLALDETNGFAPVNNGLLTSVFTRSTPAPYSSTLGATSPGSFDFQITPGNNYVESEGTLEGLKNLSTFTLTGWVNCNSSTAGSGGNRIISWINHGGDGVDLVYQSDGSLRLGVDGWPDFSPAFSSPNKVKTVARTQTAQLPANWVFFAVTYDGTNGQVQFYFGDPSANATLDVTRSYTAPGLTGSNIGKLAIGNFNSATRNPSTYDRMFRGSIDDIRVYGSILSLSEVLLVQGRTTDSSNARIAMSPEPIAEEDSELKNELYQNYPNPYSGETEIGVSLVPSVRVARVTVNDLSGRALKNVVITERGKTNVKINGTDLNAGMYFYSLIVDGKVVDIKRMVLTN